MSVITDDAKIAGSFFLSTEFAAHMVTTIDIDTDGGISLQCADGGGIDALLSSVYMQFTTVDLELNCRHIWQGAEVLS